MFEIMRKVFGPAAVTTIIGAIALVFVFYGVYNPRSTKGTGAGALAATVNGDSISLQEFSREYQQRVEFYQNMMKGKADVNLLKQLGLQRQVIESLISRKLMTQEAQRMGMVVPDEEVRQKVLEMPYFKKDNKFDTALYERVLEANHQTPASFEDMIREDLLRNHLIDFLKMRARTSEKEIENEFVTNEDRRQIDYVLLNTESAKKRITISEKEIDQTLADQKTLADAKLRYEQNKYAYMKPQPKKPAKPKTKDVKEAKAEVPKVEFRSFDEVKRQVVVEMLKDRRVSELAKINQELADDLMKQAKAGSAQFAALVKSKGLEIKTSEKFNRTQQGIPGLGDVTELLSDAFKEASPLLQERKIYNHQAGIIIAMNLKAFKPDLVNFSKEREKLEQQVQQRKEQAFYEQWMGELRMRAKVSVNKSVETMEAGSLGGGGAPEPMED